MSSTLPSLPTLELKVEKKVLFIRLNRPERFNAINGEMYSNMADALNYASTNKTINIVCITGNGKYFSSGNDLSGFMRPKGSIQNAVNEAGDTLKNFLTAFLDFPKPIVVGVNGPAIGIAVTVLGLCDIVYGSNVSTYNTPFSSLGQSPEGMSSYLFPRLMGYSKANEILLLGKKLNALEAKECGLISDIWNINEFNNNLKNVCFKLSNYPNNGLQKCKKLIRNRIYCDLKNAMNDEIELLKERWQSNECKQAVFKFFAQKMKRKKNKL